MTPSAPAATPTPPVAAPKLVLPSEKQSPSLTFENSKIWLYGEPGIGKTTFATQLEPDTTLLLATEPGYGGLEAFVQPIRTWAEFRDVGAAIAAGGHDFKVLVVDTVDQLQRMCQDHVMAEHGIKHPSDLEWGKGWQLVGDEFKLRVGKLCSLGCGVLFISHAKDVEIELRVGKTTKTVPTMPGAAGAFLEGFVDFIFLARMTEGGEGEQRELRTQPSQNWVAKQRTSSLPAPLADPLPLDPPAVREVFAGLSVKPEARAEPVKAAKEAPAT